MQFPLFETKSDWKPPLLSELPEWSSAKRVGVDIETCDPNLKTLGIGCYRDGFITGVSFALEDGPSFYLPMRHQGGDNLPVENVLEYLRAQAEMFKGDVVGANLQYDLGYLFEEKVVFPQVRYFRDIQVAAPLLYELHDSYSLHNIALREGLPGKDEDLLKIAAQNYKVDPKKEMWKLPARFVGPYATVDAERPLQILRRQERQIEENNLWEIYNLESEVTPVLVHMRKRGVLIDQDKLAQVKKWSQEEEKKALEKVFFHTGCRIPLGAVWKPDAIAPALEEIGVKLERTSAGKPSIRKDILEGIDHPVADALAWARKTNKLRTTFAKSVENHMVKGRIHCTFNQIAREDEEGDMRGARYGRLSCVNPNLQQQPARDQFAKMWRSIYIPEPGCLWAANDYSQQEPRWTTHYAALLDFPKAGEVAQRYRNDPSTDNHEMMTRLIHGDHQVDKWLQEKSPEFKKSRSYAKNIFLGLCYGEGGAKLCDDLGLPTRWALVTGRGRRRQSLFFDTRADALAARSEYEEGFVFRAAGEEGQYVLDTFDKKVPFIKRLAQQAQAQARKNGFITTGGGRRLHFPQKQDGSYDWTHKALNRLIQGTSADQTKRALVEIHKEGHYIQLQVHDEIDGSVQDEKEAEAIAEIMRNAMPASLPFKVDTEIGPSWGESME